MPFARVGKRIARGMPNIVTMSLNQNKANKTLVVHIGEEVAEDCGFKLGERAEVLWGDGDDLGIVMLVIPEEKDIGVMWKDNMPRMSHSTTRMPEWALPELRALPVKRWRWLNLGMSVVPAPCAVACLKKCLLPPHKYCIR